MFNGNSEVEEVFSEAWQKVLAGHSIESAVSGSSDHAAEVEPMLRLTTAVRGVPPPALSVAALTRIQERAQEAVREQDRVAAIAPRSANYTPYIAYIPPITPRRSPRSWLASLLPTLPTLRSSVGVMVMLAMLAGTMAIITALSRQADSHQPLETYGGTITKMTDTAWWIGSEQILVDSTTKIYGQPRIGAEMVCIGRSLPGDQMKALEVWIRLAPDTPPDISTPPISLHKITGAEAPVIFL